MSDHHLLTELGLLSNNSLERLSHNQLQTFAQIKIEISRKFFQNESSWVKYQQINLNLQAQMLHIFSHSEWNENLNYVN